MDIAVSRTAVTTALVYSAYIAVYIQGLYTVFNGAGVQHTVTAHWCWLWTSGIGSLHKLHIFLCTFMNIKYLAEQFSWPSPVSFTILGALRRYNVCIFSQYWQKMLETCDTSILYKLNDCTVQSCKYVTKFSISRFLSTNNTISVPEKPHINAPPLPLPIIRYSLTLIWLFNVISQAPKNLTTLSLQ